MNHTYSASESTMWGHKGMVWGQRDVAECAMYILCTQLANDNAHFILQSEMVRVSLY